MIHNLTSAEWKAVVDAAVFTDEEWAEQGRTEPAYTRQRQALTRALGKIRQLAPEDE